MVLEPCYCNFGIPGVETLPAHNHMPAASAMRLLNADRPGIDEVIALHFPLAGEIVMWVDWKAVARALGEKEPVA